ncbi:GNAT family N-acetyltransferase [Gimesia sp.]|uniref:GNAT family N-acetyltransferase n=1 Tax=Gimesia sp. TaxID=2024833 RepID=UPI000C4A41F7|nr:GNAT family N-acetyltransferase [Gimesia sp.]MAX37134.1 GNAT family N-acetyltransferase [Gimesia sp.]HBL47000.1 GNAT family N-acetyltransferase [Planctomycetaceae bacterium]|tara:strand:+ start:2397 stop:2846 length:450 start_codon:yes stop_codon:yes gene_type:complete
MKQITIRQAVLSDLDALVPLFDSYRQFYGRPSDAAAVRGFLQDRLQHGESVLFLASEADTPLGFTQLYPSFSSVSLAQIFILNDLFVTPAGRRQGIATRLIAAAADYARSVNAIRLSLSTEITNQTAQALYQSVGWQQDEQFLVYHLTL